MTKFSFYEMLLRIHKIQIL